MHSSSAKLSRRQLLAASPALAFGLSNCRIGLSESPSCFQPGLWQELGPALPGQSSGDQSTRQLSAQSATGESVVATVHPLATQAALNILKRGGNAIDACIAAATTLSVVDGHNSGIGGGCLILIRSADGSITAIDGRETAPAAAHRDLFLRDRQPQTSLSQSGPLAIGVPGEVAALALAHQKFGAIAWKTLFEPAIEAAQNGFEVGSDTASSIASEVIELRKYAASANALLHDKINPPSIGDRLVQSDLAGSLQSIADHGPEWFYRGPFAQRVSAYLQSIGGIITTDDFARYEAKLRPAIETRYREYSVFGFPPPSSGGMHVAQMLMMLEPFPLKTWFAEQPARYYHVLAEAMKLAFADRAHWLGDSDFVPVPTGLIDPSYIASLRKRIHLEKVTRVEGHAEPPDALTRLIGDKKHTTHLTVADSRGNWVAMTATINTSWGSKVMAPETGVILNNQMDDFSIAPGTPNAFGLVGAEANSVAPGKRPLSSMSPTIVLREGQPIVTCGAAGGPRIINATLQTLISYLDLGLSMDRAIHHPRIHHQWRPDTLLFEPDIESSTIDRLVAMGHAVKPAKALAVAQGIGKTRDGQSGKWMSACDPRAHGLAGGIE